MADKHYEIRDPVHNFITFNEPEKEIINSPAVQRLKYVKQLGLTYEVYPGATHSRFEHSLGTMELATQAFDIIVQKMTGQLKDMLGWSSELVEQRHRQTLRLGALLHDIGHAPFSHTAEELLPAEFHGHEGYTEALIRSHYIQPLLERFDVRLDVDEIVAIALGPEKKPQENPALQLLGELVAGDLGVDRMDYLVRDALHTGATAGRFDYHRLLNTLTVIENPVTGMPVLAIEKGGRHSAEGLILARYFMFLQVYFHDVRRIYDIHLVDFLAVSASLENGRFPAQLDKYLELTDDTLQAEISASLTAGGTLGELASRLRNREHYRAAFEIPSAAKRKDPDIRRKLEQELDERFPDLVRTDESTKEAFTLEPGRLYIVDDNGNPEDILQVSELIRTLAPMWIGRVYAHRDVRDDVKRACGEFIDQGGGEQ